MNARVIAHQTAKTVRYQFLQLIRRYWRRFGFSPVTLTSRWLRVPGAVKYSGLSRSKLYELLSEGRIRSICVRSQKAAQREVRLVDRESIAICCNFLVGYGVRHAEAEGMLTLVRPLVVSISLFLIADIDSPRGGVVLVQPQNLVSVAHSLHAH
jgi:hypothetical protein